MKISENKIDDLNLELTLDIAADDYAETRKKKLNDFRHKAEIKGFRKGMVPMSLVEKMYGQQALYDAVNDTIASNLDGYVKEHKLNIIGEPLPSEEHIENVWESGKDFKFKFDIACNPEINLELGKDDEIVYYNITVSEAAKKEMKENLLRQYGSLEEGEAVKEDDFMVADLEQGETKIEGTYIAMRNVAEAAKSVFVGLKPGDSVDVNVNEAFENETDRAAMLKVKKEELASLEPMWKVTVKSVKTFVAAKMNKETYDKIFGEGVVTDAEGFDAKITERLSAEYAQESDFRFSKDAKDYIVKKAGISIPEAFLKRWIFVANDGKFTKEEIEKEFDGFAESYKWQLIRTYLMEKFAVKLEKEDLKNSAKGFAAYQFAMYGMYDVPQEQLDMYADKLLEDNEQRNRIFDQVENEKTLAAVKNAVTLKNKKISVEKFRELK